MPLKSVSKRIRSFCGSISFISVCQCFKSIALKNFAWLIMSVSAFAFLISCKHQLPGINDAGSGNNPPASSICSPDSIYFQQQVLPLFASNCSMSGCHDNISHAEGLVLTTYNGIVTGGIRAGNPGGSKIYKKLIETNPGDRMPPPPHNPLSAEQINLINKWITQGAKNNSCLNATCDTANVTYAVSIKSIISSKCQGCHSGSSAGGGYDLSSYAGVKARVNDGRLWGSVNYVTGYSAMPKNGIRLSTCELVKIKKWIEAGAPNN